GRPGEVLGGDQLDLVALAVQLAPEQPRDVRVHLLEACGRELLESLLDDGHGGLSSRGWGSTRGCYDSAATARSIASAAGAAPSRTTRGSGAVKSITVDGVPGSSPPSSVTAAFARSSSGTSSRRRGSGPPGRLALVAATAPTRARTRAAGSGR